MKIINRAASKIRVPLLKMEHGLPSDRINMILDLLKNVYIDSHFYRPRTGWYVDTNIPRRLRKKNITVIIVCPGKDDNGQWVDTRKSLSVKASGNLDDILEPIMKYVLSINEESNDFFGEKRLLVELILDTDTMEATTKWVG